MQFVYISELHLAYIYQKTIILTTDSTDVVRLFGILYAIKYVALQNGAVLTTEATRLRTVQNAEVAVMNRSIVRHQLVSRLLLILLCF